MSGGSSGACLGQSKIPATVKFLMQSLVEFDRDICRITRVPQIPCMICGCYERYEDFAAVGFYRILLWTAHQLHNLGLCLKVLSLRIFGFQLELSSPS